jgi:hypothetical protein
MFEFLVNHFATSLLSHFLVAITQAFYDFAKSFFIATLLNYFAIAHCSIIFIAIVLNHFAIVLRHF